MASAVVIEGLTLSPASATLAPGGSVTFTPLGWLHGGGPPVIASVTWTATGGTVTSGGVYTAGNVPGTYQVLAKSTTTWVQEAAPITISGTAVTISQISLTPATASLVFGATRQFSVSATMSNGSTQANPSVTWNATGGTVSSGGLYTAANTAGNFRLIATSNNGKQDTSAVTVSAPTSTIASISVTPATATVAAGATRQFTASATLSNGTTQSNPPVTWSGTGGTVSGSGLFTAGSTAGTYRVIATSANAKADTSSVTVTAVPSTITAIILTPAVITLAAGSTQQFSVSATLSNGTTQANPAVTWSATGGSVSAGGLYAAGSSAGAFRVIAVQQGGTRADTSAVTVTVQSPPVGGGKYFNSAEAGCGTDGNVLWCDDFERGKWFVTTADVNNPLNAGWNGTPYGSSDPQGKSFGRCGGMGVAGTSCAATNGGHTGIGQARAMGDHDLSAATNEVYFRYYVKPLPGYAFGQEKALTFNKGPAGVGGIFFGTMFFGSGSGSSSAAPHFYAVNQGVNLGQNQGSLSMTGGNWYYIELHLKLNGAGSDVVEMWMNNCGANGLGCTGTPTLRMRYTNATLRPNGDNSSTFKSIWLENWANPAAVGEMLYDQIKVSKVGPVGFKP